MPRRVVQFPFDRRPARATLTAGLIGVFAACSTGPAGTLPPSEWGGDGISLLVTATGGTLEFDCAAGSLEETIVVGADGRFRAEGLYVPGTPGPVREDDRPQPLLASYSGRVRGGEMTLSVRLQTGDVLGPYALGRSRPPSIRYCL